MKWEYACLVGKGVTKEGTWIWTYTFHAPSGKESYKDEGYLALLNNIGQDGWELVSTEPRYAHFREDFDTDNPRTHFTYTQSSQTIVERTFFFKRLKDTEMS